MQVNIFPDSRESSADPEGQRATSEVPDPTSELDASVDAELDAMLEDMGPSQADKHETTYTSSIPRSLSYLTQAFSVHLLTKPTTQKWTWTH
jgi:hypothetical protein